MNELWHTLALRSADWQFALLEHLRLSLAALLLAIVIALPLAVLVQRSKRAAEWVLQAAGVFQTLPSLAILGLLIPLMGIGTPPAVTALVVYALFPILQGTVTGLNQIDPNLQEAAEAFGMTRWERLKKFELDLAMPVIMAGIRTAAVMVIGTATLAALIGAGGLGNFILLGIDRNNSSLIIIGAVSCAALALLFNYVLKKLEGIRLRHSPWAFAALLLALAASFAVQPAKRSSEKETLIVAGKLGSEPEILIQMYKQLIEAHTGLQVETKPNFGKTGFLYEALKAGEIDIYPEFTGTITASLLKQPPAVSNDPAAVYQAARDGILKQDNLVLLPPMAYQNTYAIAVKQNFARQHNLHNIGDLQKTPHAVAGFTLEFNDREDGNLGLKRLYGLNLHVKILESALRYQAIQQNDIQVIDAYSTDSELRQYNLVLLNDNRRLFPPYQGAPLLRQETLAKHPEIADALNRLSGKISAEEMQDMNYRVKAQGEPAEKVAREYLQEKGLIQ